MNSRLALLAVGLSYAIWEAVDVYWIGNGFVAVFSALFLAATVWLWRRRSSRAAVVLLALCAMEAGFVPMIRAELVTRAFDAVLGIAGVAAAVVYLVGRRRAPVSPLVNGEAR